MRSLSVAIWIAGLNLPADLKQALFYTLDTLDKILRVASPGKSCVAFYEMQVYSLAAEGHLL